MPNVQFTSRLALALLLGASMAACSTSDPAINSSLYSVHQPVIEREAYRIELASGASGIAPTEEHRLAQWFATLGLRQGDRVAIADATGNETVHAQVAAIAAQHGVLLGEPVADAPSEPGRVGIVVNRAQARVPDCPDWSDKSAASFSNAAGRNFGCAINSNYAAMIADSEHLLRGAVDNGDMAADTASKAIGAWRAQEPTGTRGLPDISSREIEE